MHLFFNSDCLLNVDMHLYAKMINLYHVVQNSLPDHCKTHIVIIVQTQGSCNQCLTWAINRVAADLDKERYASMLSCTLTGRTVSTGGSTCMSRQLVEGLIAHSIIELFAH